MVAIATSCCRAGIVLAMLSILASGAVVPARAAMPESQPLDDIRAAAIAALGAGDAQSAEAVLAPRLRMARCSQPLQAVASGRRTAQVRCEDTPGWRLYVPVRVRREADVVVLRTPAMPGVPIAADQLLVQRRDVDEVAGAPFDEPHALVGRMPSRLLAAGSIPTEADLAMGQPLRRGDPVVLVSRAGPVEVRMRGRALDAARAGGTVAVENMSSHRVLRGRIVAEGVVELVP